MFFQEILVINAIFNPNAMTPWEWDAYIFGGYHWSIDDQIKNNI